MNRLIIIGASGHGKVVADIARLNGYEDIIFLDADTTLKECLGYPIVGKDTDADNFEGDLFVAVGNQDTRRDLMEKYKGRIFPVLIHPSVVIAKEVTIGKGTVVMAGAVINSDVKIGQGCIINTCASVDHECNINDYVHIAVGTHLCGNVNVGKNTWIGAGAIVSNDISICEDCMIGAGSVVINDLNNSGTYIGVPAKKKVVDY